MPASKYQSIKSLETKLSLFRVPPLCAFNVDKINNLGPEGLYNFLQDFFDEDSVSLAIRSSSQNEDNVDQSSAGAYESVLDVNISSRRTYGAPLK